MEAIRGGLFGCLVAAAAAVWGSSACAADSDLSQKAAELHEKYVADLETLAKWCEANGLMDESRKTRRVVSPSDPCKLYVPVLPDEVGPPKLPEDAAAKVVDWDKKLWKLRGDYATASYDMARRAVRSGQAGLAFYLALDAIQANPDYEPARRLLGYQKYRDGWRTLYETKKLRTGFVWSEKFGWLTKANLARYEKGERYCEGRWISAEEDAKRHSDIRSGWNIETEHYLIRTDHSIEAAVALGAKLERLNRVWQRLFIRYYASQADLVNLFEGRLRSAMTSPRRHVVYLYRDRDDYVRSLKPLAPNIEITTGYYYDNPGRAYFFMGEGSDERMMYHEATHQLFHESRPVAADVGRQRNCWILEGIAMFMESLRREDGYDVLGGFDDERLHAARYRLLHDKFYLPLDDFVDFGMDKLQKDPRIRTLYSEAAGLTHFLIFYDGARYRDALISYLSAIYSGRDDHDTLAKLTGQDYDTLDKQYRKFLEAGPTIDATEGESSPAAPPARSEPKK